MDARAVLEKMLLLLYIALKYCLDDINITVTSFDLEILGQALHEIRNWMVLFKFQNSKEKRKKIKRKICHEKLEAEDIRQYAAENTQKANDKLNTLKSWKHKSCISAK